MIVLGKRQILYVVKKVDFGVYLAEKSAVGMEEPEEKVLLPKKQVPENILMGDELEVFIYRDSMDRLIATVQEVLIEREQTAVLNVADTSRIGAFLDWGLEKDLLLPFKEQTMPVKKGDQCLVALYEDKSNRLCDKLIVYPYLHVQSPYILIDNVKGRVYEISKRFGVFVAVDDQYSALIPAKEAQGNYRVNDILELRVTQVKEDGKLNVSARKKAYVQLEEDAHMVLEKMEAAGGVLFLDDKSDPALIQKSLGISKAAFKRAAGHLKKEGKISLEPGKIVIKKTK